ncbi:MAG: aminotransferase class V-fold PLP-dependent enzyme [Candidatus Eisenbacteria bacterium]|nr:aminotransferase class V-fold PLP-dependent enzyme [Candidatus Latescibacterota bacterium]MBD3301188.1 aminotransferase class V-fold PLP-dependent enzyme [Candidatus Eisenbacteria bacterium]
MPDPERTIYLDNAATSHPKPPEVAEAIVAHLERRNANPGRSGHRRSIDAARTVHEAREAIAALFGLADPLRVVLTANATESLNLALFGLLAPGDHVVTSAVEHNSVMRPLRALEAEGVTSTAVPCDPDGTLDPTEIDRAIRPATKGIVLTHASNVVGTILPIREAGRIARDRGLLLLVDAATTAGAQPIDVDRDGIDLLAITGHKGLLGPTGTGALLLGDRVDAETMRPLKHGGTGSRSEEEQQPPFLPDRFEAGTLNAAGLAGLTAGIGWIRERGIDAIRARQVEAVRRLIDGLMAIGGVRVHGTKNAERQMAPVSITIEGLPPSEIGRRLDADFGILCRVGLHCAPSAHRAFGTFPDGTVRLAPGVFTTDEEIDATLLAVDRIAGTR